MESNKIIFKDIRINNFLSIGPEIYFNFQKHNGMNYVFGTNKDIKDGSKNGAGKSNLFCDAILFSLFGRTSKRINKPNIVNRLGGKKCEVDINISINEKSYNIINGVNPTFCQIFEYKENGEKEDITKSSIKETQKYLTEEILKTTYDVFKNSMVLSVNDTVSIFEMTKYEKRDFIEDLFNLSIFGNMFRKIKDDLNSLDKQILVERNNYEKVEKDIDEFKIKLKNFDKDKLKIIQQLETQLTSIIKESNKLDGDDNKLQDDYKKYQDKLESISEKNKELEVLNNTLNLNISSLENDLKHGKSTLVKYSDIFDIVCKTCTPKLDRLLKINDTKKIIPLLEDEIKVQREKNLKVNKNIKNINDSEKKLKDRIIQIKNSINKIEDNKKNKTIFEEKIKFIKEQIEREKLSISPFQELIEKYSKSKNIFFENLSEQIDQRKYLDYLVFALSENGVKKYIISDLINMLNNRIRKYLEELGAEYTVIFDPNFQTTFLTSSGECEYDNFSAGERRRVDLSTIFAFRDILYGQGTLQSSILVCDEMLDISIDESCIGSLIKILKDESKNQTVFVISHRECVLEEDFDNVIELSKSNGFTKIISDPQGEQINERD